MLCIWHLYFGSYSAQEFISKVQFWKSISGQVIYAKTDVTSGSKGITAFIIEKGMKGYAPCTDTTSKNWKMKRKYLSYLVNDFVVAARLHDTNSKVWCIITKTLESPVSSRQFLFFLLLNMQILYGPEIRQAWDARKWYVCTSCPVAVLFGFTFSLLLCWRWPNKFTRDCRCELVFENCFIPEENVLGQVGKGVSSELTSTLPQISCLIPLGNFRSVSIVLSNGSGNIR